MTLSRSTLPLLCGAAALAGACKKSTPAAQAAATVVTVTSTDYAFVTPDTISAGLVTFRLLDTGREPHQAVVMRLDSGKTIVDLHAAVSSPDMRVPAWLSFPVGVSVIVPGDSGNATAVLTPGHYVMGCFI